MTAVRAWLDIDLDRPGAWHGSIYLPVSRHESAYSVLQTPISSIRNGSGPCVLLTAGIHGDEFEGQILLRRLAFELRPESICGHVIILPAANSAAVLAGTRGSPLDGLNLNRSFPGAPDGSPTEAIAYCIETELVRRADIAVDFHSGGSSLIYTPIALIVAPQLETGRDRLLSLLQVFGMPTSVVAESASGGGASLAGACERAGGVRLISTELGGGNTLSLAALRTASAGLVRVLHEVGLLVKPSEIAPPAPTRLVRRGSARSYLYAQGSGLFEHVTDVGEDIAEGQTAGLLYHMDDPRAAPQKIKFEQAGLLLCRRAQARVMPGDCLAVLGSDMTNSV